MKIDTRLSERVKQVLPSPTLSITAAAKKLKSEGKDVVSMAAGEPDFDTPDPIKTAAIEAINSGFTKYTPTTGIPELKKLIAEKLKTDNSLNYGPDNIVVSNGAKHSIFNTLFVLVDQDEEVLIPSPYWVSYPEMAKLCGAVPKFVQTQAENDFKVTPDELEKHITARTKVFILNSPSNPCGTVYSEEELRAIAEICVSKKIFVISDEIYEKIVYDGMKHSSIASFGKEIFGLTVTVNGLSKSHSMTGWRIGYCAAPGDIAAAMGRFQDHSTSNPVSISQKAAVAALRMPGDFSERMRAEFQSRRDYIVRRLSSMKKISCVVPRGAFYIFCDITGTKLDSMVFCQRLLSEQLVAAVPGSAFGKEKFIRMSFATGMKQIETAMDRLEKFLSTL